jgi:hypothetical protein
LLLAKSLNLLCLSGAPDRIRTCDLCLRRAALYPAELRVQQSVGVLYPIGMAFRNGWR